MNLKKSILSFMAAGAILAGGFGSVGAQSAPGGQTTGTVKVEDGGYFNVYFCGADITASSGFDFDDASVTSSQSDTVQANAVICYDDDTTYRGRQYTSLSATSFVGQVHNGSISNANLSLGTVSKVYSGQWGSVSPKVGSISAININGATINNGIPGPYSETFGPNNLSSSLHIHNVWPGAGTAGSLHGTTDPRLDQGSFQTVEFSLEVPAGTRADDYESTFTLTVSPTAP